MCHMVCKVGMIHVCCETVFIVAVPVASNCTHQSSAVLAARRRTYCEYRHQCLMIISCVSAFKSLLVLVDVLQRNHGLVLMSLQKPRKTVVCCQNKKFCYHTYLAFQQTV